MSVEAGAGEAETGEKSQDQGRVAFQLRIGVTGHRDLSPDDTQLREAVKSAIRLATRESGYPEQGLSRTPLWLTVVSALAEGADRIVADAVLNYKERPVEGSNLVCVLPVPERQLELYRDDFETQKSKEDFDRLLSRAWRQIEAPGHLVPANATQEQRNDGYLWAGKEVVRNCDVLIAIWDRGEGHGKGGTADLVNWARGQDAQRSRPRPASDPAPDRQGLAHRMLDLVLFGKPAADEGVFDAPGPLRIIVSPSGDHKRTVDSDPLWTVAAVAKRARLAGDLRGLDEFNGTTFTRSDWERFTGDTAGQLAPATYQGTPTTYEQSQCLKHILKQLSPALTRADQAAMKAQKKFFWWSYGLFASTALATIIAAIQAVILPGIWELTLGELALIIGAIIIVYLENKWKNNNKHWFVYRFFAERLRTSWYLLAVGIIPETEFDIGGTADDPTQNEWVWRAYTAILAGCDIRRQEPPADFKTLTSLILDSWMGGQRKYYDDTSKKMMRRHNALRRILYSVLGLTIIAAALHSLRLWPFHSGETDALVMCAIGLPAVVGALSNVRNLREFSRHSFRYARMAAVLRRYREQWNDESDTKWNDKSDIKGLRRLAGEVSHLLTTETRNWLVEVSERRLEHG
jgi:hypothetical protein